MSRPDLPVRTYVDCASHGHRETAFVCPHIAESMVEGKPLGFHFEATPDEQRAPAFCTTCAQQRAHDAEPWPAMAEICVDCYDDARRLNGLWASGTVPEAERQLSVMQARFDAAGRKLSLAEQMNFLGTSRAVRHGRVTWGCTVQANNLLFSYGRQKLPGEVVYVTDPTITVAPLELTAVADRLYALKGTHQADPAFATISRYLANETTRVSGLLVPDRLSFGLPCAISSTLFVPANFPDGVLSQRVYPVIVQGSGKHVCIPLPSRFWSEELRSHWATRERASVVARSLKTLSAEFRAWPPIAQLGFLLLLIAGLLALVRLLLPFR
jgi:hypothetical protein